MNDDASAVSGSVAMENAGSSDALLGMAALGKTAAALALVIALILLCAALLRRWGNRHARQGVRLQVVGSTAVGNRERVVIVDVEGTWLVLGVGSGQVSKLHELPAPPEPEADRSGTVEPFAQRFAQALKRQHNPSASSSSTKPDSSS